MSVYFAHKGSLIKIGYSATPERRAAAQGAKLLAFMPGGRRMERVIHHLFEEYRSHGEWFHIGGRLHTFVEALAGDNVHFDLPSDYRYDEATDVAIRWQDAERSRVALSRPLVVFS